MLHDFIYSMKHYIKELVVFFHIVFFGLINIIKIFILFFIDIVKKLSFFERLFFFSLIGLLFCLGSGWLSYTVVLSKDYRFDHVIYSDDFLIFLIAILVGFISIFLRYKLYISSKGLLWMRLAILFSIGFFWLLSFISPERIAPLKEAMFTNSFWLFIYIYLIACFSSLVSLLQYKR